MHPLHLDASSFAFFPSARYPALARACVRRDRAKLAGVEDALQKSKDLATYLEGRVQACTLLPAPSLFPPSLPTPHPHGPVVACPDGSTGCSLKCTADPDSGVTQPPGVA